MFAIVMASAGIGTALLAFGLTGSHAAARLADALPAALQREDLELVGVVSSLPSEGADGIRFMFDVESARSANGPARVPARISLGWYTSGGDDAEALPAVGAGQRWRLVARLKQPHGNANPEGFDSELWMFEQGIRATGSVRATANPAPERLAADAGYPVERLRQWVRDGIFERLHRTGAAGVVAALAVGDQAAIDHADWGLFRITGIAHLVAVSGMHITMFAWLAATLCGSLCRRSAWLMLRVPAPVFARWCGLLLAIACSLLAGWGIPAQRTVAMLAVGTLLRQSSLRWPWPMTLGAAGLVVIVLDPWALLQSGFWLSFVAVGLLTASGDGAEPAFAPGGWLGSLWAAARGSLRAQATATIGLAPLTLLFFHQLSVVGFAANLAAIPLVTFAITPLALAGVLVPAAWSGAAWLVACLEGYLQWLASWHGAAWTAAAAPAWIVAAAFAGAAAAVLPLPARIRWLVASLILPLMLPPVERPGAGRFDLMAIDIGQGTSVLVRTREHALLFDAGPLYGRDGNAGERVVLPLLRSQGVQALDALVLSHRDADHVGGAASLLDGMRVGWMLTSLEEAHPLRRRPTPHFRCVAGQRWQWDGVRFEVLHPFAEDAPLIQQGRIKPNATSCVLRVADDFGSALLTGDLERAQEAVLVERSRARLAADVLMVPHHGSRTSSSDAFLEAVHPAVAVVQAGYLNRFGHPAPDVAARYTSRGITLVRSDQCGAWSWTPRGPWCQRDVQRRYWHHSWADLEAGRP